MERATFEGSFLGLAFVLAKGKPAATQDLVAKIFSPNDTLGEDELAHASPEAVFDAYEGGHLIPFLTPTLIRRLHRVLEPVTEAELRAQYDAQELNEQGIYPCVWHTDDSPKKAYNARHLVQDLVNLKSIIRHAAKAEHYILVFVG